MELFNNKSYYNFGNNYNYGNNYQSLFNPESESDDDNDDTMGTSGLINLGNTCYMNSIIQCLSNCNPFRDFIIGNELIKEIQSNELQKKNWVHLEDSSSFEDLVFNLNEAENIVEDGKI